MAQAKSRRRGSKISTGNSKGGWEFSKKIVFCSGLLFLLSLIDIRWAVGQGLDVSNYATEQIVTTGGIFGASVIFYLNKSKIENLSKGKIRFLLLKLRLELKLKDKIPEESYQIILDEIKDLESMLDNKLDRDLEEAIEQEVEIQHY